MPTGKHTLVLNYNVQQIDPNIPNYHRVLPTAWLSPSNHHIRINPPVSLADILHEPLFRNPLIAVNSNTFYYSNWIHAGIVTVRDLCYSVLPGFMPALAIHEILTLHQTTHQLTQIQRPFPPHLTNTIRKYTALNQPTLQPNFALPNLTPDTLPIPLDNSKANHFYHHLLKDKQLQPPALNN